MLKPISIVLLLACLPQLWGCEGLLNALDEAKPPTLEHKSTELTKSPELDKLAAYFCPQILDALVCEPVLGAPPAKESLRFDFQLTFRLKNPNDVPIPTLSMLLAIEVFKDQQADKLGAVCVTFCKPDDPSCKVTGATESCKKSDQKDIQSWDDVAGAAVTGLLNFAADGPDGAYKNNGRVKMVPAQGELDVKLVFSLGVDPTLSILSKVMDKYVNDLIKGTQSKLDIPYSLKGTFWVELPYNAGRFGVNFGPLTGNWSL